MSLRTIQTWLSVLTKEEYLHRQYGRYSLSDKGSRAVEYLMDEFANHALGHLCNFKPNEDLGESVALFTEVFGAYIVYSFIRAMYPTEGRHISLEKEAKIISASIRGAISPMRLFHCFATTSLPAKTSEGYTKPPWKLDKVTYENFMNEFKSRYPHYYEELEEAWQETVDRGKAAGGLA